MTTCNDIQRKFLDHDWDQAALDDAAAIAEHLKHCGECRTAISQYEQLRTLLRIPGPVPEAPGPEAPVAVAALPEGRPGRTFRRRPVEQWAWTAALAVSLLIGVIGWTLYLRVPRGEAQLASSPTPAANHALPAGGNLAASRPAVQWTQADIARAVQVFENVAETFGGQTSWVALGDRRSDLGLMPSPATKHHKLLLVRLTMSQGGQERSRTDLIIVPGEDASLDVPFGTGQVLHYSIATPAGEGRRLSLWAEVRAPQDAGETLAALATSLKPLPGQVFNAGRLVTSSGGYNLEICCQEKDYGQVKP